MLSAVGIMTLLSDHVDIMQAMIKNFSVSVPLLLQPGLSVGKDAYSSKGMTSVDNTEMQKKELRSRIRYIRRLEFLHVIAAVFIIFVLLFILSATNAVLAVAGLIICLFSGTWIIARLINLMAEYDKTVAKLKIVEFFPAMSKMSGADIPDEIIKRMSLDAYKVKAAD